MPIRDPHEVLGVARGANQATIKAAWRRLARENHPDVAGGDPATARAATRRMAQINAAYEEIRDGWTDKRRGAGRGAATDDAEGATGPAATNRRTGGPPRPRPTRPVTGRVDTADTYRARNRTTTRPAPRGMRDGRRPNVEPPPPQPPRSGGPDREPPRASDPTGPLRRSRSRTFKVPEPPELAEAAAFPLEFGKFHGHTLGEVAAFEPSYIDWIASTVTRDAGLVAAARVLRTELDRRGIVRRRRETERQRLDRLRQQREWTRIFSDAP
ncbi:MAG TPA: J domain-containing protein [Candidatus Acidoferrum sp.]|nr:J domain-containing protein [Candidatus Acidoferrum sp.]